MPLYEVTETESVEIKNRYLIKAADKEKAFENSHEGLHLDECRGFWFQQDWEAKFVDISTIKGKTYKYNICRKRIEERAMREILLLFDRLEELDRLFGVEDGPMDESD